MKANSDKTHLLLSCIEQSAAVIDSSSIESNIKEVLLGIKIGRELKSDDYVNDFCKKEC